ncbi:MAG TPA: hypothetical protein VF752_02280 [Thermoleophilaceae bacterium]
MCRSAALSARLASGRWLTVVTGLAAAAPVIAATLRALHDGWMPVGDQGIIATRAYDVFSSHMPLLGQYSEASVSAGHAIYSPGPMLYWLLALPAYSGVTATLTLTIATMNCAAIVGSVALARRRGGLALMLAAAIAVALLSRSFSPESLHDLFNPSAALFPLVLLIFLCWSLACGEYRLLPLTALVASFVAQAHLAYVAPVAGALAVGLVGLALSRTRLARLATPPAAGRRSLLVWSLAAVAVTLVCWSAPIADQIEHHPGNLSLIAQRATASGPTQGAQKGRWALERAVGVPPRWLRSPTRGSGQLALVSGGDYGDTRLSDVSQAPSAGQTGSAIALLAALLVVIALAAWRRRGDLVAGAAIAVVLCVALVEDVAKTPITASNTLGYSIWWGSIVGMWAWLILGWSAWSLLTETVPRGWRLRVPAMARALGLAAVAAVATALALGQGADTHAPYYRPLSAVAGALDRAIPPQTTVGLVQRGGVAVPIEPAIRYTLRIHGVRALGAFASRRPGAWYELDHRRVNSWVSVNGDRPSRFRPARVVARAVLTDPQGSHRVTATLSPPRAVRV